MMHPALIVYFIGFVIAWVINIAVWQYKFGNDREEIISSAIWGLLGAFIWPLLLVGYLLAKAVNKWVENDR